MATGIQHSLVLDLRGDDVHALTLVEVGNTLDGKVIGFRRAGGPDNFPRIAVHEVRDLASCDFHGLFRLPAELVRAAGRVTELAFRQEAFAHFLSNPGVDRRCRRIVKINRCLHFLPVSALCQPLTLKSQRSPAILPAHRSAGQRSV